MVQGWESRAHLANKRREEARERKQSKKGPQKLNGEVIINQLIKNKLIDFENHSVEAWVENESGGKAMCYSHFRAESCLKHKRCKFSHDFTISLNRGHQYSESEDNTTRSEAHMDCYRDLKSIPAKEYTKLSLLFLDKVCIYDKCNAVVWQKWYERQNAQKSQQGEDGLKTISEVDSVIPDDESVMSLDTIRCVDNVESSLSSLDIKKADPVSFSAPTLCPLQCLPPHLSSALFEFMSDVDICNTYVTAMTMKNIILADEVAAERRKSHLQSVTLSGKELSKLRKQEKKKKMKQANLKDTKKGHKAVKVCRR